MARARVVFDPAAEADYVNAFAWYWERSRLLAIHFEQEINRALRLIAESPGQWPPYNDEYRRMIVRKFPYSVIYKVVDAVVFIVAVAHAHRRPNYWRRRRKRGR